MIWYIACKSDLGDCALTQQRSPIVFSVIRNWRVGIGFLLTLRRFT